jgi:hypothetical protein
VNPGGAVASKPHQQGFVVTKLKKAKAVKSPHRPAPPKRELFALMSKVVSLRERVAQAELQAVQSGHSRTKSK